MNLSRRHFLSSSGSAMLGGALCLHPWRSSSAAESGHVSPIAATAVARRSKIVVTGGHPGDPEYGCGGTIARLSAAGNDVVLLYLNRGDPRETPGSAGPFPRVAEATRACELLTARPIFAGQIDGHAVVDAAHNEAFRLLLAREKPDAVFTHWPIDNHADHRAMSMLVYDAWRSLKKSFALFYYEVSNGEDTVQFSPTTYVDITATVSVKRKACFAHASQEPDRYYRLQESITQQRGKESGHAQAEGFVRHIQSPEFALP